MAKVSTPFVSTLQSAPHEFLQPSLPLYTDAIAYLKNFLDPLAKDVSAEQQQRLKESRKKRKRGEASGDEDVLRLKQLHTDGFAVEQVWEQARRVIDAAREEAEREIEALEVESESDGEDDVVTDGKKVKFADEESAEEEDEEDLGVEGVDYEIEGVDDGDEVYNEDEDSDEDALEGALDGEDEDMHDDFDDMEEDDFDEEEPAAELVTDKFGLNDGFFSIDDFNKQSEFLEQQDAQGDNDGAASDEEDVDWDADPLGQGASAALTNGSTSKAGAEDSAEEDDEDGPTFGDPDALSEDDASDLDGGEMDGLGSMGNTNEVMYKDFFAPPAQKKKKANKKGRPHPHNFPSKAPIEADDGQDLTRTMEAVHRDLFEDEASEEEPDEEDAQQIDPSNPLNRRSAHERRRAALAEEIRKLEAANVAKREWTLSGEARAADRPVNSLLEQDLDFERAGKPIPVITAEISESIEELIKRRILAFDFQDIPRRRPDDLATGDGTRRGRQKFELDDSKSKKGLAEEYEEEHLRLTDPNYTSAADDKTAKEEKEITALWREVSSQLDSLSSWSFRPKAPAPTLDIRVDAPVVTLEDARPSAGGDVAGASQLAPQEVYRAGEGVKNERGEVVGKSGLPAGREELSRDERKRRRRREKERGRKALGNVGKDGESGEGKGKKERKEVVGELKRGGVKVIGKKGEMRDVEGREVRESGKGQGAARFML
ncbi:unnamed protein product [Zymoseptoria tritici ST99CH_1E4]|uniref:U3 small nucleolar ribonucleoprotein protein MPP10 n=1 Tax=Zymoseptoria tritici ST99CH_1E4 TaxID=1276532 RepID=A0A2H1H5E3_ZYMTR|nr:unnamed protein product [Zymoseptoria tritici ST99CH_1E4]